MSGEIIAFQFAILISIMIAGALGKAVRYILIGSWIVETLIFAWLFGPLIFIQFASIFLSNYISNKVYVEQDERTIWDYPRESVFEYLTTEDGKLSIFGYIVSILVIIYIIALYQFSLQMQ